MIPSPNNYSEYSIEDFLWDENFRQWVTEPDADLDIFWGDWMDAYPEKRDTVLSAKQILKSIRIENKRITDFEIRQAVSEIRKRIDGADHENTVSYTKKNGNGRTLSLIGIAASFILIAFLATYFVNNKKSASTIAYNKLTHSSELDLVEKVNKTASLLQVRLEDGSKITLEPNAKISFPMSFKNLTKRKIYLSGEAFFEVAKNPEKPFFVYANGLITKVLGTKFRIRSKDGEKNSTVEVTSGIVAVYSLVDKNSQDDLSGNKLNNLILTRNQKASFSNDDRTLLASIVANPQPLDAKVFRYRFTETPVKEIIESISENYGIDVIYDDKLLGARTVTADLNNTTMYQKLDVLCKTINCKYDTIDGKIIISPY